jgi:hypothetical protein
MLQKIILTIHLILLLFTVSAQDPRDTEKWKSFFDSLDFSSALDLKKHPFEHNRYYDGLVVFKHQDSVAKEMQIRFLGFDDLSDPAKKIEGRENLMIDKKHVYCFVFAGNLFMRTNYKEFAVGSPRWGRVVLNGPLRLLESYQKNKYSDLKNKYGDSDYSIQEYVSKYGSETFVSPTALSIGYCKNMRKLMSEAVGITEKACAKQDGYQPKNFTKVVKEFNAYIAMNNTDLYRKSIEPRFFYVEFGE